MKLLDWCIERRILLFCLVLLLAVAGIADLFNLPVEPVPDISPHQVLVTVQASGLPTQEVEKLVTSPIEKVMSGVMGLRGMRSVSRTGVAVLYLQFYDNTDILTDREMVIQRLPQARASVAVSGLNIDVGPLATGMGEILQLQIASKKLSLEDLNRVAVWNVAPALRLIEGVTDVNVNGGASETYEVVLNPMALRRYGISISDVFRAVDTGNSVVGGAWIVHNDEQHIIVGRSLIDDLNELGEVQVRSGPNGEVIHVRDIGSVRKGQRPRLGSVTRDGNGEIVSAVVMLQQGANALQTLARIEADLPKIQASLTGDVHIIPFYNRKVLTEKTIDTVRENLLTGAFLVFVVLLISIGDLTASLIIISVIPFALIAAMVGMHVLGISANLLSLGAIDFGMVVDSSLVIVENILHRRNAQENIRKTIIETVCAVIRPVTFAVLIIALVYLPILTLEGVEGRMFKPMAETVILALISSLLYSLIFIPALCVFLGRKKTPEHHNHTWFIGFLWRRFQPVSSWCMAHTGRVGGIALCFLVLSGVMAARLGGEFIPQLQEGDLVVTSTRLPGISLESSLQAVQQIEQTLRGFPDIRTVISNTGTSAIPTDPQGGEQTDTYILLKPRAEWKTAGTQEDLVKAFNAALITNNPGSLYNWSQPIQMRMDDLLSGVRSQVAIGIYGSDMHELAQLSEKVADVVGQVPGAADVAPQDVGTISYLHIDVNRTMAARLNVDTSSVMDVVEALGGHYGPPVFIEDALIPTQVRFASYARQSLEDLKHLPVITRDDKTVNLDQVATLTLADGPPAIRRDQGMRRVMVQANVRGRDLSSFVQAAQKAVRGKVALPPGYRMEWSGQFKNLQTAVKRLEIVVPVMLGLIFFLLVMALGQVGLAGLVFVNLPFAATGGVIALYVRSMSFSISAGIGFIALFGVATMNGLVLVSYISDLRQQGLGARDAAIRAVQERFRPVMATATVACLGFFPMAFSMSEGAEVEKPLATVVIGGLITCTMLTLLVLPTIYSFLYSRKKNLHS